MPRMGVGPTNAKIMLIGEAFGEAEERAGEPFLGASGQELNRMLHEAGITRSECYVTNVVNARPHGNDFSNWLAGTKKDITPHHIQLRGKYVLPIVRDGIERLYKEISLVNPNVVVPLGNIPLWALTENWGILKWRGSVLQALPYRGESHLPITIPTIHPAAVIRQWEHRAIVVLDLKKAGKFRHTESLPPITRDFVLQPSLAATLETLNNLLDRVSSSPLWIDFDLETAYGHITCAGLSWSRTEAICIPFTSNGNRLGYWSSPEEEGFIIYLLYKLLTHPNAYIRGQNLLYDAQYTWRHWHFVPNVKQDTMISHHTCFCGLPKSLAFQASIYCERYTYWKEMHKDQSFKQGE